MNIINYLRQFDTAVLLHSNAYENYPHSDYDWVVGLGVNKSIAVQAGDDAFTKLREFYDETAGHWRFCTLAYDLKNEVESLHSAHPDGVNWPDLFCFVPQIVLCSKNGQLEVITDGTKSQATILADIAAAERPAATVHTPEFTARLDKATYLDTVERIRQHIIEGDVYEMNLCQEFYAEQANLDPYDLFEALNKRAAAPFAAFFKHANRYVICTSPERFLKKIGQRLISQPIKGTIRRNLEDYELDAEQMELLYNDEKNRAENVMIVDLVRNDLARTCVSGTVSVPELFGVYTFKYLHHLISTVQGDLLPNVHPIDAIKAAFPMGSMTGAPKVMAMQLIEQYEKTRRGLYSGSIGYLSPNGDFDFNVVIRSLFYNADTKYLTYQVGGAIVYDSVPEEEYEECVLKAKGLRV